MDCEPRFAPIGAIAHVAFVRRDLEKVFDLRHRSVERLARTGTLGTDTMTEALEAAARPEPAGRSADSRGAAGPHG